MTGKRGGQDMKAIWARTRAEKSSTLCWLSLKCGGGGEIRTLGWFPIGGFQDRCLKPLGHPSARPSAIVIADASYCAMQSNGLILLVQVPLKQKMAD